MPNFTISRVRLAKNTMLALSLGAVIALAGASQAIGATSPIKLTKAVVKVLKFNPFHPQAVKVAAAKPAAKPAVHAPAAHVLLPITVSHVAASKTTAPTSSSTISSLVFVPTAQATRTPRKPGAPRKPGPPVTPAL